MARAAENQEGYTGFGGGTNKAWLRVKAPYDPSLRTEVGLSDKPGGLVLEAVDDSGTVTTYWLWIDANGIPHLKTSEPTDQDETTTYCGPKNVRVSTIGIDPQATLPQGSALEISTTITGVATGDLVLIERSAGITGLTGYDIHSVARVSTTDTIRVRYTNLSTEAITPEPETIRYTWFDFT